MLNTCTALNPFWKMPGIPGKDIYHNAISISIEDIENLENDDFLI